MSYIAEYAALRYLTRVGISILYDVVTKCDLKQVMIRETYLGLYKYIILTSWWGPSSNDIFLSKKKKGVLTDVKRSKSNDNLVPFMSSCEMPHSSKYNTVTIMRKMKSNSEK